MDKYDIVYVYKYVDSQELKYSLRSVEANMTYNSVWLYGDEPKGIQPDHFVDVLQSGWTAGERVMKMIKQACENPDITDDFWLFNDDFFVLKKLSTTKSFYAGQLADRITAIEKKHKGKPTAYTMKLRKAEERLKADGLTTKAFDAVHTPMLINKAKALETIATYPDIVMFRSMYGNMHKVPCIKIKDTKIHTPHDVPAEDARFVSTNDISFKKECGRYIRRQFTKPSRFEVRADG